MRRGRDSNPGYPKGYNGFRDRPVQPLRHLSEMFVSLNFKRSMRNGRIIDIFGVFFKAERVGFEPTVPQGYTRFPVVPIRPLSHLSEVKINPVYISGKIRFTKMSNNPKMQL